MASSKANKTDYTKQFRDSQKGKQSIEETVTSFRRISFKTGF